MINVAYLDKINFISCKKIKNYVKKKKNLCQIIIKFYNLLCLTVCGGDLSLWKQYFFLINGELGPPKSYVITVIDLKLPFSFNHKLKLFGLNSQSKVFLENQFKIYSRQPTFWLHPPAWKS